MRRLILILAALLAWPTLAAARPHAHTAPAAAPPAWMLDPAASRIGFASSFNGTAFTGQFRRWTAQVRFDPANLPASSALVTIDLASVITGDADRDQALPTADWFDVAAHPTATFRSTQFRVLSPGHYVADGILTIRGVPRPLTLPFTLAITGQGAQSVAHMTAQVSLNRAAFGIGRGQWATGEAIPLAVGLTISVTAHRAP
jgi:polyisoprenoid-binding protein YceI